MLTRSRRYLLIPMLHCCLEGYSQYTDTLAMNTSSEPVKKNFFDSKAVRISTVPVILFAGCYFFK